MAISGTEKFQEDNEALCEIAANMKLKTQDVAIVNSAMFKALHFWRSPNLCITPMAAKLTSPVNINQ
jgi:hypothetical protein